MEVTETVPVLCMCRLCLNYSGNCIELTQTKLQSITICNKIKKYLNVELSPTLIKKENGTFIITLQTTAAPNTLSSTNVDDTNSIEIKQCNIVDSNNFTTGPNNQAVIELGESNKTEIDTRKNQCTNTKSLHINLVQIERELDALATDDITAQIHEESDNEDAYIDDEPGLLDESVIAIGNLSVDRERLKDLPTKLIEDSKLLYKGRDLLEMISKFYRLECDRCSKESERLIFDNISSLCQHYVDSHQIKGYVICCNTKLIKPRAMALHMARHLQPDAFKCVECNKMLTCPKILKYHLQNHLPESERPLACSQCPRRFSYSSALVAHSISHQPEHQRAVHVCDECGKVFVSAGRLTTHINISHMRHGQNYSCHICKKNFACRSNLTYHLTTHEPKVRQVQCSKCDKWLKNKLCLRKHMVQHSSIRYNCSDCDYSALNRQCLRNHMRVQHTNDKPFACDVCGKAFKLKNTLMNHSVQHTGVRKFVCPFCNRTFASSGNFYSHRKRMHPQELAALKCKQEEDERRLREQSKNSTAKQIS